MKERLLLVANFVLFIVAVLFLGTIQTSLWYQVFGYFPGPALWVAGVIYFALNRSTIEAIIFAYLVALVLSTLTATPEGILMIACVALSVSARVFKERSQWSAISYLMLTCGLGALMFHVYHLGASLLLEEAPLTSPQLIDWIVEALLTSVFAPMLFPLFRWFDRLTDRENEISAQVS